MRDLLSGGGTWLAWANEPMSSFCLEVALVDYDSQQRLTPQLVREIRTRNRDRHGKPISYAEIGRRWGLSRERVRQLDKENPDRIRTPRQVVMENFPWTVPTKFHNANIHKRMRDHAEYMATGGKGMAPRLLKMLREWYNTLESYNVVVEFDPNIEPSDEFGGHRGHIKSVSSYGGFAYRVREDSDGDLIIRVNEHTRLTAEGKRIWVFPPERP